jgi:hypothetical protein
MIDKFLSDKNWKIITLVLFIFILMQQCSTNGKIKALKKDNEQIKTQISAIGRPLNQKQTFDIIEKVMFDFLIYEDDLDKGKTNLTDIKTKIEN